MPQPTEKWHALILAASRGPNDPMAKHYGVSHKCLIEVGGEKMLARVVRVLGAHRSIQSIRVSIEDETVLNYALGNLRGDVIFERSTTSAPASVMQALGHIDDGAKVLVTTADHALLDTAMLDFFMSEAEQSDGDLNVGLARDSVILKAYPHAKRTFLKFGADRVSGCNLFAFKTSNAVKVLAFWQQIEKNRKNPFKLVAAFGFKAIFAYLTSALNLEKAFALASGRIGVVAKPVLMPFANAAIDVDKPEDKDLVEEILADQK